MGLTDGGCQCWTQLLDRYWFPACKWCQTTAPCVSTKSLELFFSQFDKELLFKLFLSSQTFFYQQHIIIVTFYSIHILFCIGYRAIAHCSLACMLWMIWIDGWIGCQHVQPIAVVWTIHSNNTLVPPFHQLVCNTGKALLSPPPHPPRPPPPPITRPSLLSPPPSRQNTNCVLCTLY